MAERWPADRVERGRSPSSSPTRGLTATSKSRSLPRRSRNGAGRSRSSSTMRAALLPGTAASWRRTASASKTCRLWSPPGGATPSNKLTLNAEWDLDRLAIEIAELRASDFDISLIGFNESEIDDLLKADEDGAGSGAGSLAERFMIPPFSVLNARGGWWQERKAAWLALGIQSQLGRGENSAPGGSPRPLDRAKDERGKAHKNQDRLAAFQKRKRPTAEPGGSKMPAADYRKAHARGDGRGRAIDPQG